MSKKNMESTRELMGTSEVTDYSIRTYKNPLSSFIRITISVEIPTGVSGHSVNTRQPRMNRRF